MLLGGSRWDNPRDDDHSMFCHIEEDPQLEKAMERSMLLHLEDDDSDDRKDD